MDKAVQKVLFAAAGLPVVPHEVVREPEWEEDAEGVSAARTAARVPAVHEAGAPRLVRRHHEGASPEELPARSAEAFRYARKAVIEQRTRAVREIECAVLGNDDPVASVCGEIVPEGHEFYDYEAKYLDEHGAQLVIPARSGAGGDGAGAAAWRSSRSARSSAAGMARVDFFLAGDDEVWVNEINTIPGFTSISMYPKLWEASGLAYPELDRAAAGPRGRAARRGARQDAPACASCGGA